MQLEASDLRTFNTSFGTNSPCPNILGGMLETVTEVVVGKKVKVRESTL
jgi:hypothetical protein